MKKISLFFLLIVFSSPAFSQTTFDRILNIPVTENGNTLQFPWAGGINYPWISPIDLNLDGRNDLFLFDRHNNRILTFVNNGNTSADLAWEYAAQYALQFPPVNVWAFLFDYNCDGKADFFTYSSALQCAGIAVYKNISTSSTNLQWVLVDSCMKETFATIRQNIFTNSISLPHFVDFDGDGDMDILGYNTIPDGRIIYHKNYSMEHYGNCDSLDFNLENFCLGNFALKVGGTNTVGCFHCPCRVGRPFDGMEEQEIQVPPVYDSRPSSDQSEAAKRDDTVSGIMALDVDGDGNKELLVGDIASFNTLMVHNGGTEMDYQDSLFPSYNSPAFFRSFHYHVYMDVDNDGKRDLLVEANDHENKKGIWYYKNTNTDASPLFDFRSDNFLQKEMIDGGDDGVSVLFDYDDDGLLDLVLNKAYFDEQTGTNKTGLILYKNIGTATVPAFDKITEDFAGLTIPALYVSPIYPAFGDLDNDGDKDMVIGLEDGRLHYYENTAGPGNPATFTGPIANYMRIDIGKYATPQLYDIDKDGLLDIICGGQRGFVNYFKNRGSLSLPLFDSIPTNDTLGCIVLQAPSSPDGYTVPFLYDSLGSTRLLVANEKGNIFQYDNIDGNLNGCFHNSGTVFNRAESSRIKFNITVSGGDLNGDSLTDIIIGQATGGAEIRYQHNPTSGIKENVLVRPSFEIFPNPVNDKMSLRFYNVKNKNSKFQIFNSLGESIFEENVNDGDLIFNAASLSSGLYFVRLTSENNSTGRKFIIAHK